MYFLKFWVFQLACPSPEFPPGQLQTFKLDTARSFAFKAFEFFLPPFCQLALRIVYASGGYHQS